MPDHGADGTMSAQARKPGSHEAEAPGTVANRTVTCPDCGANVELREAPYGVNEPSAGLACPSCGVLVESS
jgi:hypothetical protein